MIPLSAAALTNSGCETPIMLDGQWRWMYMARGDLPLQKTIFCLATLRSRSLVHGSAARGLRLIDTLRRGARDLLGGGTDTKKAASTKRRAGIKYSDKKRVERFREYATGKFAKRNLDGALTALIGDLALDTALRDRGRTERELDEGAPWEALRWQRRWDPSEDDGTLRWKIPTALEILGMLAHVADESFESTHGGAHRKRGASNAARWGNGLSDQAKHVMMNCTF